LNEPFGVLKATATAIGTATTFHCTNAEAVNINIGDKVKIYGLFIFTHTLRGDLVTITNKQIDTPGAGTTRFTFTPALGSATAVNDKMYDPEIVDVLTWISNNMTILDDAIGAYPCTSTTRPTGSLRKTDMLIFERDTLDLRRWDSGLASWELVSNPRHARGQVAYVSSNAVGTTTAAGSVSGPYLSASFTAKKDQWYQVFSSYNIGYVAGTIGEAHAVLRRASGGVVTNAGTKISSGCADPMTNNDSVNNRTIGVFKATADEQITVGLFLDRSGMVDADTMAFTANSFNMLAIEDMGQ